MVVAVLVAPHLQDLLVIAGLDSFEREQRRPVDRAIATREADLFGLRLIEQRGQLGGDIPLIGDFNGDTVK